VLFLASYGPSIARRKGFAISPTRRIGFISHIFRWWSRCKSGSRNGPCLGGPSCRSWTWLRSQVYSAVITGACVSLGWVRGWMVGALKDQKQIRFRANCCW